MTRIAGLMLVGLLAGAGPATRPVVPAPTTVPATQAALNTVCPVMDAEVEPDGPFRVYQGRKILFCCTECADKFDQNPERYVGK